MSLRRRLRPMLCMLAAWCCGCQASSSAITAEPTSWAGSAAPADAGTANAASPRVSAHADASLPPASADAAVPTNAADGVTLRAAVQQVRRVEDAHANVFIPPYLDCREPLAGETGLGPNGQVCAQVAVSGCTEPGKLFSNYASCDVVRTQRPFWPRPPAAEPRADDPRLNDADFMRELSWVTTQVEACGCVCCHDSNGNAGQAGQWDIRRGPIWLDTLSDSGLALFVGLADSSVLGAYPPADNFGFDRTATGLPTTDTPRMKAFLEGELARRGISEEEAAAVPPFGGPIQANRVRKPGSCKEAGHGIAADGRVIFQGGLARYVYVLSLGSENPGVPPNLDLPVGTLWRLDVLASADALASGLVYGTTPPGSFQAFPEQAAAPALELGQSYQLTVLRDVGVPLANCIFNFGDEPSAPKPPATVSGAAGAAGAAAGAAGTPATAGPAAGAAGAAGASDTAGAAGAAGASDSAGAAGSASAAQSGACALPAADGDGFGASCQSSADCTCKANYCALMPGQPQGTCTIQNCKTDPAVCPSGYSCFDLSVFGPDLPSICTRS